MTIRAKTTTQIALAVAVQALVLAGCGGNGPDVFNSENSDQWFTKPFANFSRRDRVSNLTQAGERPVAPEDFVDGSGHCAFASAPVAAAPNDADAPAVSPDAPRVTGGIALLMTECEVVARAGTPQQVDIGAGANNERTAVLTYMQGPWPGIYRFKAGRLAEVERVVEPEQPKPAPRKKKPAAKPKTAARQ